MCAREVQLKEYSTCKHQRLIKDTVVDCKSPICYYSAAHPQDCPGCKCNRWMGKVERHVVERPDGYCDDCCTRKGLK
ncbi:hypothetical protein FRB95_006295 [Tulasnella sp. JGI-2019a]|nr:hypothetical protein FRB95_006295 [Tulasnella sp. JGI-2019a]